MWANPVATPSANAASFKPIWYKHSIQATVLSIQLLNVKDKIHIWEFPNWEQLKDYVDNAPET